VSSGARATLVAAESTEQLLLVPAPSEWAIAEGELGKGDDTEIPAELVGAEIGGSPRNDAPRNAVERARYWVALSKVPHGPILKYLVVIKRRMPDVAQDIVSEATERALGLNAWPGDEAKLPSFLKGCARYVFYESCRRDANYAKHVRNSPDIDAHAWEPPREHESAKDDLRDLLKLAAKVVSDDPKWEDAYRVCMRMAETEESIEDAARALDMNPGKMRMQVTRFWQAVRKARQRGAEAGAAISVAVALILLFFAFRRPVEIVTAPRLPPAATDPLPALAAPTAAELRARGIELCRGGRYKPCLVQLDRAKAKDPQGDLAPEVTSARAAAKKAGF
jgi:DNA-directed RNA polymerase specialized sigma24 family protein